MSTHTENRPRIKIAAIVLIVLGALSLLFPLTTGMALNLFFGVLLAIAGVTHFIGSYQAQKLRSRWGQMGLAAALAIIGLLLVFLPGIGVAAFALLLSLAFIIQGGVLLYSSLFAGGRRRYLTLAGGIIGILGGVLMLANWPDSGIWLVGVLAGVNLIGLGVFMLTTPVEVRKFHRRPGTPQDEDIIDVEVVEVKD